MPNAYESRLIRVLDYIHDNPAGDLSLDTLAEVAALSRFHFHRVFHAMIGETAAQTVRRLRMYRASVALIQTAEPLAKIAKTVGYPNLASFTRSFTEGYGITPKAFRAKGELRPLLPNFKTGETLMYPVTIRFDPARHIAAIPHKGPYMNINRAFEKLGATIAARGLFPQVGKMIGVYYDSPADVAPENLRSHAGFEVQSDTAIAAPLEPVTLPAGRYAVLLFKGPYAGLPAAYNQLLGNWLPNSNEPIADVPMFEIYLNTPMDTAPEDLLTEICLALG
jgi:AraC family transcriptional regulator